MPVWIIISFIILSALCIFATVKLYADRKNTYGMAALAGYVFYGIAFGAVWVFGISVPSYVLLLTMLAVLGSSFFGHYLQCYTRSRTFDRYLHAFGAFGFALFAYCVLDDFIGTGGTLLFRSLFIFTLGNTIGVIFEFVEMLHDIKNKKEPKSQKGLQDTNMDMVFNLIGSLLAAVLAYFVIL